MDRNEVLVGLARSLAPPTILGLQLGEWGTIAAIVCAVVSTIAALPNAIRTVKGWMNKEV